MTHDFFTDLFDALHEEELRDAVRRSLRERQEAADAAERLRSLASEGVSLRTYRAFIHVPGSPPAPVIVLNIKAVP